MPHENALSYALARDGAVKLSIAQSVTWTGTDRAGTRRMILVR